VPNAIVLGDIGETSDIRRGLDEVFAMTPELVHQETHQ
jgi:hypothetical protein